MALNPSFTFQQAQYVQAFPLKPAPFCMLFAGLDSTNKSVISHLSSTYLTLALSSPPCPLLHLSFYPQTLWHIWQELSFLSCNIRLQWVHTHSFLTVRNADDKLARREAQLVPSVIPCSFSSLISRIHFSRTEDVLSHRNSSIHRFPQFPPKNLCSYFTLAVFSLVYAATYNSFLLSSYFYRIGGIENPSCSACGHSSQDTYLILHCPATNSSRRSLFGDFLSPYDLWSRPWRVALFLRPQVFSPCPHPSEGVG